MTTSTQLRGNCQLCGRQQAAGFGAVAKHGYRVDHGYFSGVCHGHDHAPVQEDRTYLDKVVADISSDIIVFNVKIDGLKSGAVTPCSCQTYERKANPVTKRMEYVYIPFSTAEKFQQKQAVESAIYSLQSKIRAGQQHIDMLLKIATEFHGKDLIKVVKPVAAPRIEIGEVRRQNNATYTVTRVDGARVYYAMLRNGLDKPFNGWVGSTSFRKMDLVAKI